MAINLPNLTKYKQQFTHQKITTPLPTVPFSPTGLIAELPPPPNGKMGWPWTVETKPPAVIMPKDLPWPKISIVIPSYNQGQFIEETIRSVLLQNYPNLELIIFDGGSNDETQKILEKYSPWLSFWQSKKDRGQGHAINLGFSIATGDYFGWVNSDDFYLPKCLQLVGLNFYTHHPDVIYGDSISIYDNDTKAVYCYGNLVLDRYLRFGNVVTSHTTFWKSSIHVPICEEINCAIDYELWLRLFPKKIKKHLKEPLAVFRVQDFSKSCNERYKYAWQQDYEKIQAAYGLPPKPRSFVRYEFRVVQYIYQKLRKSRNTDNLKSFLQNFY